MCRCTLASRRLRRPHALTDNFHRCPQFPTFTRESAASCVLGCDDLILDPMLTCRWSQLQPKKTWGGHASPRTDSCCVMLTNQAWRCARPPPPLLAPRRFIIPSHPPPSPPRASLDLSLNIVAFCIIRLWASKPCTPPHRPSESSPASFRAHLSFMHEDDQHQTRTTQERANMSRFRIRSRAANLLSSSADYLASRDWQAVAGSARARFQPQLAAADPTSHSRSPSAAASFSSSAPLPRFRDMSLRAGAQNVVLLPGWASAKGGTRSPSPGLGHRRCTRRPRGRRDRDPRLHPRLCFQSARLSQPQSAHLQPDGSSARRPPSHTVPHPRFQRASSFPAIRRRTPRDGQQSSLSAPGHRVIQSSA
ncbi:hypothetical protein L1887_51938 [Cichorium endivia]|nr:hypothetical protein L1887_51938 [Cichorium endivia]